VKKIRVGIIYGGWSGEHEVSIASAAAVVQNLDKQRYEAIPVRIEKDGRWIIADRLPASSSAAEVIEQSRAHTAQRLGRGGREAHLVAHPGDEQIMTIERGNTPSITGLALDVVFPVLHGPFGEDGTLQGLLEMANIPYVGCGVLASACGMDKVTMKLLFLQAGLPLCRYVWFLRSQWHNEPARITRTIMREIGLPCFVKPANLGSSVGVSRALDKPSLEQAVELAAQYDRKIVVEEAVDAREIECAVIGNNEPKASLPGEYVVHDNSARFLDYEEKYTKTGHVDFVVPAPVSKALATKIQRLAIRAFQSIDGAGLARVDFFFKRDTKELLVNELNTMPGLTEVSGYPKMWAASGLSYTRMLDVLIELALERHREKSLNKTSRD